MKSSIAPAMLAIALGALPLAASAQQLAYTAKPVNLRAGPDRAYPVIALLPPSAGVTVYGCLAGYRWCDVSYGYDRGWVYAGNLRYPYQGGYVVFPGIAPVIGIAVLGFVIDDYWSLHYRDRPFFAQRYRYEHPHYAPSARYPAPRASPPHGTPGTHSPQQRPHPRQRQDGRPPPRHRDAHPSGPPGHRGPP